MHDEGIREKGREGGKERRKKGRSREGQGRGRGRGREDFVPWNKPPTHC